jgi:hypothetical protein
VGRADRLGAVPQHRHALDALLVVALLLHLELAVAEVARDRVGEVGLVCRIEDIDLDFLRRAELEVGERPAVGAGARYGGTSLRVLRQRVADEAHGENHQDTHHDECPYARKRHS